MSAPRERILIVDDEENVCALFKRVLAKDGYEVECAASGEEARAKPLRPATTFVMLTAFGTVQSAVEAMKQGAYDYLVKPVDKDEIKIVAAKALELQRLSREVE